MSTFQCRFVSKLVISAYGNVTHFIYRCQQRQRDENGDETKTPESAFRIPGNRIMFIYIYYSRTYRLKLKRDM